MVTQWFQPEPFFKGLPLAKELTRRGHQVTVLTGFPNYPGGQLYPGYRIRPLVRESVDGIDVFRVFLYPSHDRSSVRRALNYISFAVAASIIVPFIARGKDVAYVYHPPGTVGLVAAVGRVLGGLPFVLDVQDLWPDSLRATGMVGNRRVLRLVGMWMRATYRMAAKIVVMSPGFKSELVAAGIAEAKIEVIYNWTEELVAQPNAAQPSHLDGSGAFEVVFAGNMGPAQALGSVLTAAAMVLPSFPELRLRFVGDGIECEALKARAADEGISNVEFSERMDRVDVEQVLIGADALLVHLRDDPLFEITIPSKIQAYLAAGRPLVAAVRGDAADLVELSGAGVVTPPEDPAALADALVEVAQMSAGQRAKIGSAGRVFYERELSFDVGVGKLVSVLEDARR